jgi:uncharacterized RDD family membrane protein YckC
MSEPADPARRTLITPEGLDLQVRLAQRGERALALLIDLIVILLALVVLTIIAASAIAGRGSGEVVLIIWALGAFLLRNFYFTAFECANRAATPGKRIMGLRVATRDGAPLTAEAIFARHAMRELEFYLPLTFLLTRSRDVDAWIVLFGFVWCCVFALLPWLNRDRLRAGDILAGTWVLKAPKHKLLADLAGDRVNAYARFAFTDAQLAVYGVKELQVLEDVLRDSEPATLAAVAARIRGKIGWRSGPGEADFEFLNAYYRALRQKLERRLLFGVRKRDKFDVAAS